MRRTISKVVRTACSIHHLAVILSSHCHTISQPALVLLLCYFVVPWWLDGNEYRNHIYSGDVLDVPFVTHQCSGLSAAISHWIHR